MTTSPISGIGSTPQTAANQSTASNPFSAVDGNQFMMLLLAQLKNQNPFEPMQDKDLMAQMTQLNSLQELQSLNSNLQAMAKTNQLTEAASLIGKTVEVLAGNETAKGEVTGVSLVKGQVMLWLGDTTVPLSSLITVHAAHPSNGESSNG